MGAVAQVAIETSASGAGTLVAAQSFNIGTILTIYSITRDQYGNYLTNIAADGWSLTGKTGGVIDTDLVIAADKKSAVFTAHSSGTAVIHTTSGTLISVDSGILTVNMPPAPPPSGGGGGGGGGGPSAPLTVAGVTNIADVVDAKGVFNLEVDAWSDDRKVVLVVVRGTACLTSPSAPLSQISIIYMPTSPTFSSESGNVTLAYDFLPSGISFNPAPIVRFSYDPKAIPANLAETSLQIAYFDGILNAWVTIPSTVDTNNKFITAQISHFTPYSVTYGVIAPTPIPTTPTTTPIPIPTMTPVSTPTQTTPPITTSVLPITTTTITTQTVSETTSAPNAIPVQNTDAVKSTLPTQTSTPFAHTSSLPIWVIAVIVIVVTGLATIVGFVIIGRRK